MGRIDEPVLQSLVDEWSPRVRAALDELGKQHWPPLQQRQGFLKRLTTIPRHIVEGPVQRAGSILWAVSHTRRPSGFDKHGSLTRGEREYWIVSLHPGGSPCFEIEGAQVIDSIPAQPDALLAAFEQARLAGPKRNDFYGNRGPLSHR